MNPVLKLILEGGSLSTGQIAEILNMTREEVELEYASLKAQKILLGWRPILHPEYRKHEEVRACIQIKIHPDRDKGYDRIAKRISSFEQVESCYLMSAGTYDLTVTVEAPTLQDVATFVYERIATIEGVTATATHFVMRAYKEQGFALEDQKTNADMPMVSA